MWTDVLPETLSAAVALPTFFIHQVPIPVHKRPIFNAKWPRTYQKTQIIASDITFTSGTKSKQELSCCADGRCTSQASFQEKCEENEFAFVDHILPKTESLSYM